MPEHNDQAKVLAQTVFVFEIRVLLSGYLGSENDGELVVRQAAHLAYALHNQALAVLEGRTFDVADSIAGLEFADRVLAAGFTDRFNQAQALSRDA